MHEGEKTAYQKAMTRVGWLSTGRDKAARDLLKAVRESIEHNSLGIEIPFVFSNREPGEHEESDLFFNLVKDYRIPLICFSSQKFRPEQRRTDISQWRLAYDMEIMRRLEGLERDICVLAGYMLIIGEEMCRKYTMINLHPAAPDGPSGTWQEVIWQLIEQGASDTGVMMHVVTPELDKGPPLTYCRFPIRGGLFDKHWDEIGKTTVGKVRREEGENAELFAAIRSHGLAREFPLIIGTLRAFSEGKVRIEKGIVTDSQCKPIQGYDLTQEIESAVRREYL